MYDSVLLQEVDISGYRAAVSFRSLGQFADRARVLLHFPQQRDTLGGEDLQQSGNVVESHYAGARNRPASISQGIQLIASL